MALEPADIYHHGWLTRLRFAWLLLSTFTNRGKQALALLDNSPLRDLLDKQLDFENIDRALGRRELDAVGITATSYCSGRSVCFFQSRDEQSGWERARRAGRRTLLNADHLMASAAMPMLFPATEIDDQYYGDGALRQSAPLSPALHLGADRVFVIGVSGNRQERPPRWEKRSRHSPSFGQVFGHLLTGAFVDNLEADLERLERINQLLQMIPEQELAEQGKRLRQIDSLVISPSEQIDEIAGRNISSLPKNLQLLLRSLGATASGGGASSASYLLFTQDFIKELIDLGYKDTMWETDALREFFDLPPA